MTGHVFDPPSAKDHAFVADPSATVVASVSYESIIGPATDQGQTRHCVGHACWALLNFLQVWRAGTPTQNTPEAIYAACKAVDGIQAEGTYVRVGMDVLRTNYGIGETVRLASLEEIKQALSTSRPVAMGVQVDYTSLATLPPTAPVLSDVNGFDGGHALLLVGYDDARQALRARCSYGMRWADAGHCWVPYGYLGQAMYDAWTVAHV